MPPTARGVNSSVPPYRPASRRQRLRPRQLPTTYPLAMDSERQARLRETARVFLQTGGSYTATAEQLYLHRNTAQYRVQKAEELRGRPFREGRLDVELALLACHWLGSVVLQPGF